MEKQIKRACGHNEISRVRTAWLDGADSPIPEALTFERNRDCRACRQYPTHEKILSALVSVDARYKTAASPDRIAHIAWAIGELYAGREVQLSVWRQTPGGGFMSGKNLTPDTVAQLAPYENEGTQYGVSRCLRDASPEALARYLLKGACWWRNAAFFERLETAFKASKHHVPVPLRHCGD